MMRLFVTTILIVIFFNACKQKTTSNNNADFKKYYAYYLKSRNESIDSLQRYSQVTDSVLNKTSTSSLKWLSNQMKGLIFTRIGEYERAIKFFERAKLSIVMEPNADTLLAKTYNTIGVCYKNTSNYNKAIESYLKALSIYEKRELTNSIIETNIYIAILYQTKGDLTSSKQILKKIIGPIETSANLTALHTLANIYGEQGQIDSALYIDNTVIKKNVGTGNIVLLSSFYNNKALCFIELKKLDSAYLYFKKSYDIDSLNFNPRNMGANLAALGRIYSDNNKPELGLQNYIKAVTLFKKGNYKQNLFSVFKDLSRFYQAQNNWKTAYLYKDSADIIEKEINSIELKTKFETLQIDFETQKKDEIIHTQTRKLNNQKILLTVIIVILLLISIVFILLQKYFKSKRSLIQQQLINTTAFEAEQQERSRIARDLHDSVGQKLSVVKMQLSIKQEENSITIKNASHLLDETIQEVRSISHNLIPYDLSKGLTLALNDLSEQINFTSTVTKIHLKINTPLNTIKMSTQIELMIYRVVQEITNNALKYAKAKNIHITMDCEKRILKLNLADDGVGFDQETLQNIKGIGIKNIKERINQVNGTLQIETNKNNGTRFYITIPI